MPCAGRSRGVLVVHFVHVTPRYEINLERPDLKLTMFGISPLCGYSRFWDDAQSLFYVRSLPSAETTLFYIKTGTASSSNEACQTTSLTFGEK